MVLMVENSGPRDWPAKKCLLMDGYKFENTSGSNSWNSAKIPHIGILNRTNPLGNLQNIIFE